MTIKEVIDIFSALLTPVIAGTTVYVAWQQYQVSRLTLKKDLYEKRLRVYQAFMSYLSDIARDGKVHYNRVAQFYAEVSESIFLFDDEIVDLADEFYQQGINLWHLHNQIYPFDGSPGLPVGDERNRIVREESALFEWFLNRISTTRVLFQEQMAFQERNFPSLIKSNASKNKGNKKISPTV